MTSLPEPYAAALDALQRAEAADSLAQIMPAGVDQADAQRRLRQHPEAVVTIRSLMAAGRLSRHATQITAHDLALALESDPRQEA